jgi:hypothetical protein
MLDAFAAYILPDLVVCRNSAHRYAALR